MERTVELPFGAMPGSFVVNLAAADMFVHAWDLARATGQSTDLDPELADDLYGVVSQMLQPQWRGPDGQAAFGEEQTAAGGRHGRRPPRRVHRPHRLTRLGRRRQRTAAMNASISRRGSGPAGW